MMESVATITFGINAFKSNSISALQGQPDFSWQLQRNFAQLPEVKQ